MTELCRRCGCIRDAHAHFPKGFSRRAMTGLVYTWCSLCPPGACDRFRWRPAVLGWLR